MTIERHNIVTHAAMPSIYMKVVSLDGDSAKVRAYKLSLTGEAITVPVSELEKVADTERAWINEETRFSALDWTFDRMDSAARAGVPMSLVTNNVRHNFVSVSGSQFTLSDGSEVRRSLCNDYALGTAEDWALWNALAAEQRELLAAGTVIALSDGVHTQYTHAVLTSSGADYPDQYVYGINPDSLEREGSDFYVAAANYSGTGKTLEEWRLSLSPEIEAGNVVSLRSGEFAIVSSFTAATATVALLSPDMTTGETREVKRYEVAAVEAVSLSDEYRATAAARLATAEQLRLLSINTVNRALQHASSNGYCQETLVALTGAGHKAPKVRITGTITIPIDVELDSKREWDKVRNIFGAVFGAGETWEAAALRHIRIMDYIDVSKLAQSETFKAEPVYGAPTVRPLA